jgi:hypothetical protein
MVKGGKKKTGPAKSKGKEIWNVKAIEPAKPKMTWKERYGKYGGVASDSTKLTRSIIFAVVQGKADKETAKALQDYHKAMNADDRLSSTGMNRTKAAATRLADVYYR